MSQAYEIITVDANNVEKTGFFCYKSKPKSPGYKLKLNWLRQRFAEGMVIKIISLGSHLAGFVEYIPGDFAWRAVHAPNYMVIHCLWVVGRDKGKGFGQILLDECLSDAHRLGLHGVAMVTSSKPWLAGDRLFRKNGFTAVDQAPPSFDLLVKQFCQSPLPSFPKNWDERLQSYGPGLTIVRTDQCPYIEDAVNLAAGPAGERNIPVTVVHLNSSQEVRQRAPSAYGVFSIIYNGKLVSYYYIGAKEINKLEIA